jgi:glycosyltransferase involved in cell wall biosynthesis
MRVMMIAPFPRRADRIDGGVAAATMYLCQALAARPDVELVGVRVTPGRGNEGEDDVLGWSVADLPLGRMALTTLFRPQRQRLRELIQRHRPHVVHAQGADLAGLLAVKCGLPAVVTAHGMLAECARLQSDPVNKLRATLAAAITERPTIRRARDLIAISPYVTRHYENEISGRIHDLPNAIGPAFFEVQRRPERGRFLYAGRIANGKGLRELVRAAARNASCVGQLVLAGATPDQRYEAWLRAEIASLNLSDRVHFAGLLTESELLREFAKAEALVLPSHQETAPMVVQQAMAAGLAVVATHVGGIPHQINHEDSGLLFQPGDEDSLTALLARFGSERELAARLGDAAKLTALSRFRAAAIAAGTVDVYRIAAEGRVN